MLFNCSSFQSTSFLNIDLAFEIITYCVGCAFDGWAERRRDSLEIVEKWFVQVIDAMREGSLAIIIAQCTQLQTVICLILLLQKKTPI